ncbi:MAG TPA: 2OG-Fe(II) oxygenase [Pyrinomonadaceae bacterium]
MSEQLSIIQLEALRAAPLHEDPYPFVHVPNFLGADFQTEVARDFPDIKARGSYPLNQLKWGATFGRLTEELQSQALRAAIEAKFSLDLSDRHTMITVRGQADQRDGRIHTDTSSKFLTLLLYLNPGWEVDGGRLRVLRGRASLEDYVVEIPPTFGSCLIFKVTDNCWHGHKSFQGPRRVLQLNYIRNKGALNRHLLRHSITAKLKGLRQRLNQGAH